MISIKKFLDGSDPDRRPQRGTESEPLLPTVLGAYRSALVEIGNCSVEACPALGDALKQSLNDLQGNLSMEMCCDVVTAAEEQARKQLRGWGRNTAKHYRQKAGEVKELLLTMARTAESVSARDQRCAGQMSEVTERLEAIASLEDLTEIRSSIVKSAGELKTSIDRMTVEGKAVLDQLQKQLIDYQARLEEAEALASRDALTGLSSRLYVEGQIEKRIAFGVPFCLAILDIDGFKRVNDEHGHLVGDELLKQFGRELRATCRATDMVGRWGGDEFILLMDGQLGEAELQAERLRKWVCGDYVVRGRSGDLKLRVDASIGLTAHETRETMKDLVERADVAMYSQKAAARGQSDRAKSTAA